MHWLLLQGQKLSLGGTFSAGALVSSVGKWLDRGLTAMMGGGSDAGAPELTVVSQHALARLPVEGLQWSFALPRLSCTLRVLRAAGSDAGRHSRRPSHSRNASISSLEGKVGGWVVPAAVQRPMQVIRSRQIKPCCLFAGCCTYAHCEQR